MQYWILCRETVKGSPGYARRQTDDSTGYFSETVSQIAALEEAYGLEMTENTRLAEDAYVSVAQA
jgi:hypothetical protein